MKALTALTLAATVLAAAPAFAADPDAATAQARAAADAAHELLVDRYRAVWLTLDREQKPAFSQRERAWLNVGRAAQERACMAAAKPGAHPAALSEQLCRLAVTERKIASLSTAGVALAGTLR